ncbi:hypothetical protein [Streptomyces sp. SPB78]|uniref:Uncharacterized protein n=1 Tax=Streptomyces phage SF3 TaxID=1690818 RepID=A0A0M4S2K5_9CAUD|nr:hypothetical protein [Streptomyces sp. SPB78]YP_009213193.1 hypothetical protein AVV12_gp66 [Streptomyces phage SF3]ALF00197.1 hypothetical protein SF3_660 [Streptomyces phage SF3]
MQHTARPDRITADDLRVVLDHWADLRALVDTARPRTGAEYLRALDAHDAAETALDRTAAPAEREHLVLAEQPAPLRPHVVDACRAVEAALCSIADEIAAEVQRSPIAPPRRAIVGDEAVLDLELLAMRDAADERRWRYNLGERTAPRAAAWLLARLHDEAGPFLPLDEAQRVRIGRIAREAARRIERTVGIEQRRAYPMDDRPCPWCGAALTMHRGGRDADTVTCENGYGCGAPVPVVEGLRTWAAPHELVALERALAAAEQRRKRAEARRRQRAAARAA